MAYHEERDKICSWNTSALNRYLNYDFLVNIFSCSEKLRILRDKKDADTKFRIFCLSIEETERYFSSNAERVCPRYKLVSGETGENVSWQLRSSGLSNNKAAFVAADGTVMKEGHFKWSKLAVRPAMRIILDEVFHEPCLTDLRPVHFACIL